MCKTKECDGPCFDLCMCAHCWRGWSGLSFTTRLRYRVAHVLRQRSLA